MNVPLRTASTAGSATSSTCRGPRAALHDPSQTARGDRPRHVSAAHCRMDQALGGSRWMSSMSS